MASQLQSQLVGLATVIADGSTVTMTSPLALAEDQYDSLKLILPTTQTVSISSSTIGTLQLDGTVRPLGRASSTATALLSRTFATTCATAQSEALIKGNNNYEVSMPKASTIDAIGTLFGTNGDTRGYPKRIFGITFDTAGGAVAGASYQRKAHQGMGDSDTSSSFSASELVPLLLL
jgi:hypothetical protein